jgi:hypothetical protein
MTIENIIKTVTIGTQCRLENRTTYEVTEIKMNNEIPEYTMKVVDAETIEIRKQELDRYNKNNPRYPMTLDEMSKIYCIEPKWFITRRVKILN